MAAKRKKHEEHEEHENHERWLITYADMITLLMVLFIVLYAISQVDLAKFQKFKQGLSANPGAKQEAGVLAGQPSILNGDGSINVQLLTDARNALTEQQRHDHAVAEDKAALAQVQAHVTASLAAIGAEASVNFRTESRGLVVSIVTDQVLFEPGSDYLTEKGHELVDQIGNALGGLPNDLSVEGHTDDTPIATARFRSNWDLSTARATTVLQALVDGHGIPPARLSAAGYGDTHPVADNGTPEGRAANRRVEIVVHSQVADTTTLSSTPAATTTAASTEGS